MIDALDSAVQPQLAGLLQQTAAGDPFETLQRAAATRFRLLGLPSTALENWKYTNLAPAASAGLRVASAADAATLSAADFAALQLGGKSPHRLVVVNGRLRTDLSRLEQLPAGVRVSALRDAAASATLTALLQGTSDADGALPILNAALMQDGVLIELAAEACLSEPLHIVLIGRDQDGGLLRSPRLVFSLGHHSRLSVIEEYLSAGADTGLTNAVSNGRLQTGATLEHHRLQTEALTASHLGQIDVTVGRDARFHSDSVVFGGNLTRVDIDVRLAERGGQCRLNGLFVGDGDQHIDHHTRIDHLVGDTHSEERYRGILDGASRGVFNGKVVVHRDAQLISARQASNNLLLSRQAEIDTKPELEIYADDVICAHGATVGELDAAALFYLRSRGIAEREARALLTFAFAEALVADMPLAGIRRWVEQRFLGHTDFSELTNALVAL